MTRHGCISKMVIQRSIYKTHLKISSNLSVALIGLGAGLKASKCRILEPLSRIFSPISSRPWAGMLAFLRKVGRRDRRFLGPQRRDGFGGAAGSDTPATDSSVGTDFRRLIGGDRIGGDRDRRAVSFDGTDRHDVVRGLGFGFAFGFQGKAEHEGRALSMTGAGGDQRPA